MSIIPQKVRKYQQLQELTSMHRETHRIRFAPPSRLPAPEKWLRFSQIPPTTSHQPPATNLASFLRISLRQPQAAHPPTSRRQPVTTLDFPDRDRNATAKTLRKSDHHITPPQPY